MTRLTNAIAAFDAVLVQAGIVETLIGGDGKGPDRPRLICPALYAVRWGRRWYVTDAPGLELAYHGGGEAIISIQAKMPTWWTPDQRFAWRINGETFSDYRALKAAYPRRVPSGSAQRIAADLSTGEEVPA